LSTHQVFSVEYDTIANVIVSQCHIAPPFDPSKINPGNVKHYPFTAIWDTGATNTVITKKVADTVQLAPTGVTTARGVGGERIANSYLINIALPNEVGLTAIPVTEGILGETGDVLIGMDIISHGDFVITNNQKTVMSFRMPSHKTIKFESDPMSNE
jgi:hypothetical protein